MQLLLFYIGNTYSYYDTLKGLAEIVTSNLKYGPSFCGAFLNKSYSRLLAYMNRFVNMYFESCVTRLAISDWKSIAKGYFFGLQIGRARLKNVPVKHCLVQASNGRDSCENCACQEPIWLHIPPFYASITF